MVPLNSADDLPSDAMVVFSSYNSFTKSERKSLISSPYPKNDLNQPQIPRGFSTTTACSYSGTSSGSDGGGLSSTKLFAAASTTS